MRLWYQQPAHKWEEALPIGNGRMGGMVFGDPEREVLQLNEDSIWSGKPVDRHNPDALRKLPEIRKLIREGKIPEAEQLALYALSGVPNCERSYQTAGELMLFFQNTKPLKAYRRELDLEKGLVQILYQEEDTLYTREVFASYPDHVIVYHMEAEGEGTIDFDARIGRGYNDLDEVKAEGGDSLRFLVDAGAGISFCAALKSVQEGGSQEIIGEHLLVRGARKVTLYVSIVTSFRERDYEKKSLEYLKLAAAKDYKEICRSHMEDYRELYGRLSVEAGSGDKEALPTDIRLRDVKNGAKDPGLAVLHFQYGRYLLIASSRPGSLPANLQGIWNNTMTPPWGGKYTININLEMNYWIAESGNLSECHMSYFELLKRVMERGKKTAQQMYGCRGSLAHHNTDLYGDTAPQDHYIPASFWVMGEAWLATHIWEHYLYTGDREFLEQYFEVLHECVLFFRDFLIEGENGTLVTSPTVSPENTYILPDGTRGCLCEGATMDNEILTELFIGYLEACCVLGRDGAPAGAAGQSGEGLFAEAEEILGRLPKLKVGRHGQIQEWNSDYDEAEPGHRHISQLYAVYPGTKLTRQETPKWMEAAQKTLERRLSYGGGHTGWSRAWIIGLWARLGNGEKAEENYRELLSGSTFPNLFDNHPAGEGFVFQIDGNMGASAAFLEMLAQSHGGRIVLLPAVAEGFSQGEITGMRLRGGITLNMKWMSGRVASAELIPDRDQEIRLTVNGQEKYVSLKQGEIWKFEEILTADVPEGAEEEE